MSAAPLLSAGVGPLLRSASGIAARVARGFHVLRIDGYSWATTIPGGESIGSAFAVGGHTWHLHYYPNGADASSPDSDSISLHLRLGSGGRVRAQFRFSLLGHPAGAAAYELPAETRVFITSPAGVGRYYDDYFDEDGMEKEMVTPPEELGCGYPGLIITKEELERRRGSLLRDDSLAVRCDVAVVEMDELCLGQRANKLKCSTTGSTSAGA